MSVESVIKLRVEQVDLNPSPIHPSWILEGNPVARNRLISSSADGTASALIWDCTAGRFNWFYDVDETVQSRVRKAEGAPILNRHFESSVSGLYFAGAAAANSFGPLLRFAYGAKFAAERIAARLAKY